MRLKTFASICALSLLSSPLLGQSDTARAVRTVAYRSKAEAAAALQQKTPWLAGVSVGFDACGAVMAAVSSYGQFEGMARLNVKHKYFPVAELGLGVSDYTNADTDLHYVTRSPYLRLGCDYNMARDLTSGNRILVGLRVGYSPYKYDLSGPALTDPVYASQTPVDFRGVSGTMLWSELVGGIEAKIWQFVHLGWSVRYKFRLHEGSTATDRAWYVPGYGKYGGNRLGASFNIIIDL